jgi:hypothetical protein
MKLPNRLTAFLRDRLLRVADRREPDWIIGAATPVPYMRRWFLIPKNRFLNIYIHHFQRSDDTFELHDHPWANMSVVLKGGYVEVMPMRGTDPKDRDWHYRISRTDGDVVVRWASAPHRVEALRWDNPGYGSDAWTLFITGPHVREWGFWTKAGWKHWRDFVGGGCEE